MRSDAAPRAHPTITWGIGDFLLAWLVGLIAALIAGSLLGPPNHPTAPDLAVLLIAQDGASIGWVAFTAYRKGAGSPSIDFGLVASPKGGWVSAAPWFLVGVVVQLVSYLPLFLLQEVHGGTSKQDVVKAVERAPGTGLLAVAATWALLTIAIVLVAPITEELLYRGLLLRSLLRRASPGVAVMVSAVVFGAVHLLGDFSFGTAIAIPSLLLVGVVSGWLAVTSGDLSRSILFHAGFNGLTLLLLALQH